MKNGSNKYSRFKQLKTIETSYEENKSTKNQTPFHINNQQTKKLCVFPYVPLCIIIGAFAYCLPECLRF
jgi:hypothetical protein